MSELETFIELFELPPAMIPHVDIVATEQEVDLVVGLGRDAMTVEEIALPLNRSGLRSAV